MRFEFRKGDRVLTDYGFGTVYGLTTWKPIGALPAPQVVLVTIDGNTGDPYHFMRDAVEPTVSTEITHALRVQER